MSHQIFVTGRPSPRATSARGCWWPSPIWPTSVATSSSGSTDLPERTGVPIETVFGYWKTEEECVLDALQTGAEQTFSAVANAFMSDPGDCAAAAHRSLGVLLDFLAASPRWRRSRSSCRRFSAPAPRPATSPCSTSSANSSVRASRPWVTCRRGPSWSRRSSPAGSSRCYAGTRWTGGCTSCRRRCRRSATSASPRSSGSRKRREWEPACNIITR